MILIIFILMFGSLCLVDRGMVILEETTVNNFVMICSQPTL